MKLYDTSRKRIFIGLCIERTEYYHELSIWCGVRNNKFGAQLA